MLFERGLRFVTNIYRGLSKKTSSPVISVIVRKFHESDRSSAEEVLQRFDGALRSWPGFLKIIHNPPIHGNDGYFSTVVSFKTLDDLIAWEQSDLRKNLVDELAEYIDGEVVRNRLWNLGALLEKAQPVKKWKTVLVLILWILGLGAILGWILDIVSPNFPTGFVREALLITINVTLISYIALPKSMALLAWVEDIIIRLR